MVGRKKFLIAVDLGGTNLKLGLLDLRYRIIEKKVLDTKTFTRKDEIIGAVLDSVNEIIRDNCIKRPEILAVGLGLPGPIDADKGVVHFFPNIPGWREVKLRRILEKGLRLPVFLDNDANLMSLAEYRIGAAKGAKNAVCLTLGTGVGGGIIIEGKLYRGSHYSAGEIGHMPVNETGPKCNCGGIACLEAYIGNRRITQAMDRVFKGRVRSLEELSRLANKGNRKAKDIWLEVGQRLGVVLSGVVNLLDPDAIVIGGGVANAGKVLFDQVKTTVGIRAMPVQVKGLKILKAKLGNNAGLIGAAILAKERGRV